MDEFILGNKKLTSRLLIGSGKFPSDKMIPDIIRNSGSEVITMALRRVNLENPDDNILSHIPEGIQILPNTSGARNAEEAVRLARLSRSMGCGNWIKIEVISDNKYLFPDNYETIKATELLANEGFIVLPYVSPDLMVAKSLVSAGASAVMPLGAPIGSNRGLKTKELIRILIDEISLPVIVDAGIGKPSDACQAMEMGADACLLNTAISSARDPLLMARAFRDGVIAGRNAYLAGLGGERLSANASSPLTDFLK